MKKVLSLFLSVLMVLSLFSCLGVTTFAFDEGFELESISFEPEEAYEFYEYTGGYWCSYYDYEEEEVVTEYLYDDAINLWMAGNVLTLNYSDGTSVEYVCHEDGYYYDENFEELDEEYFGCYGMSDLAPGTNYLTVEYNGVCCELPVEILESPVESVQFVTEEPITLMQGVDGECYLPYEGPYEGEAICYYDWTDMYSEGTKIAVNFKDGTEKVYTYEEYYDEFDDEYYFDFFDENGESLDWSYLDCVDYQEYEPWTDPGNYSFELYYMGCPFEIEVTLIEADVKLVDYIPATDYVLTSGFDGDYFYCFCDECYEGEGQFFYYDILSSGFPCEGDEVVVLQDGVEVSYFYSAYEDWFVDEDGNYLPYDADVFDYQEGDHWDIGTNYAYFWYAGSTVALPIEVVENPLVDFRVELASSSIFEETNGDWQYDADDEEYFSYNSPLESYGTELIFEFADGSERVYYYDEMGFYSDETGSYLLAGVTSYDDQYENHWDVGQHEITIECLGYEYTVTVTVRVNPIAGIEFIPAEVITFQAYEDGWWDYYCDEEGNEYEYFHYDTWFLDAYQQGNKIVVEYTNGGKDTFTYDEEIGNFVNSRNQELAKLFNINYYDIQSFAPWSEESAYNYMLVEFAGRYSYVWVNIEDGLAGAPVITGAYNGVGKIVVEWEYLPGAAEYEVYRRCAGQVGWTLLGKTDQNTFVDASNVIKADGYYKYTVRSVNSHGRGGFDANGVLIRYIAPVTGVKAINAVDGVRITWNSYPGATCQVFRLTAGSSEWEYLAQAPGSGYYVVDPSAKSGTYYRYAVIAFKGAYYSDVDMRQTSLLKYVATPKLTGISNATNGIFFKWNAVSGATGYRVYRRGAGQTYWTYLGTTKVPYYTDTGVKNASGGYYRYTVIAVSNNVYSAFDTNGLYTRRLANPTLTSAKSAKAGITVKWSAITGSQGYYVYRKTANSGWTCLGYVNGTSNTSYLDKTAVKGVTYTYTVRARYGNILSYFNSGISCKDLY